MRFLGPWLSAFAVTLWAGNTASATNIFIPNGDFESLIKSSDGATGTFNDPVPDSQTAWTLGMGNDVGLFGFSFNCVSWSDNTQGNTGEAVNTPGWVSSNDSSAGEQRGIGVGGSNGAFIDGVGFGHIGGLITSSSSIGTIVAHETYTLSVQVSDVNGGDASLPLDLDLLDPSSNPIPGSSSVVPTVNGTFQTYSKTYSAVALAAFVGDPIVIQFGAGSAGHQTDFDDVALTATAVPEPASCWLLGLGALGLLFAKRAFRLAR
jgi:hypothetical protein